MRPKERLNIFFGDLIGKAEQRHRECLGTDGVGIHFAVGGRYLCAGGKVTFANLLHIFLNLIFRQMCVLADKRGGNRHNRQRIQIANDFKSVSVRKESEYLLERIKALQLRQNAALLRLNHHKEVLRLRRQTAQSYAAVVYKLCEMVA